MSICASGGKTESGIRVLTLIACESIFRLLSKNMQGQSVRLLGRVLGALVISMIVSLATSFALKGVQMDEKAGKHRDTVRALILPPDSTTDAGLDCIGGLDAVKRELRQCVLLPMKYPEIFYDTASVRPPKGVLLHGPPGTGKTMLARAIASESKVPFVSLHSAAIESKWFGESPKILNAAFHLARTELAPCILFFDEIDSLGRTRSEMDQSCVYSLKCELLRNMDGIEGGTNDPVMVIGCTNCLQGLDPALRRRFGRALHVPRPNEAERYNILVQLTKKDGPLRRGLLRRVASLSTGMTGADLAALHSEACMSRMDADVVEEEIDKGVICSGTDLRRRLGGLTWDHWNTGGRLLAATQG